METFGAGKDVRPYPHLLLRGEELKGVGTACGGAYAQINRRPVFSGESVPPGWRVNMRICSGAFESRLNLSKPELLSHLGLL